MHYLLPRSNIEWTKGICEVSDR